MALAHYGDLFSGGVLYAPPLAGVPSWPNNDSMMLAALDEHRFDDALMAFLRDLVRLAPEEIEAYRASPVWARRVELIWTMRRESAALTAMDADPGQFAGIEVPVELLVGDRTAPHHAEAADALVEAIPGSHCTVLEGQGHGALVLAPHLVAAAIGTMLAKVSARG